MNLIGLPIDHLGSCSACGRPLESHLWDLNAARPEEGQRLGCERCWREAYAEHEQRAADEARLLRRIGYRLLDECRRLLAEHAAYMESDDTYPDYLLAATDRLRALIEGQPVPAMAQKEAA